MQEFLFDVKFFASFNVNAANESEGRTLLNTALESATLNGGKIDGEQLIKQVSIDDEIDLIDAQTLQFDVLFFSSFSVEATTESEAREKLSAALDSATLNAGEIAGQEMVAQASIDGEIELLD